MAAWKVGKAFVGTGLLVWSMVEFFHGETVIAAGIAVVAFVLSRLG